MVETALLVTSFQPVENSLLEKFDKLIKHKGYQNRSEALRDLIRGHIVEESWANGGNSDSIGTINIVYDHHTKGLAKKINQIQHLCALVPGFMSASKFH